MNIYVISAHDSMSTKDIAYAVSKEAVDEYFSLTTGRRASLEVPLSPKKWWDEEWTSEDLFQNHREGILYQGNDNLHWYSFRVEKSL